MRVLILNIWRYYEWEERKEKVLDFLKRQDADIILLQEAASSEKSNWENQVKEINEGLEYPFEAYSNMAKMTKWHGKAISYKMNYGLGIISKFKIKNFKFVKLVPVLKEKDFGFLYGILETPKGDLNILSVHFENTDKGSKEQLKETLKWCKERKIFPIIGGDFNMRITEDLKEIAGEEYEISYFVKEYKSFMPTQHSNNKEPITLDYIIAHKKAFQINDVECIQDTLSDHCPVIADVVEI